MKGCRCDTCREGHAAEMKRLRMVRFATRVRVAGRLIAPVPAARHGTVTVYTYYGCRCVVCTETNAARERRRRGR